MKNIIAGILDFAIFFVLWLGFRVNWMVAFFLSTSIVLLGWYALEWIGWFFCTKQNSYKDTSNKWS